MTELVRTRYRRHRRASWGGALLVVLAIAAVVIPFASGAGGTRPPTYTFTGNSGACAGQSSVTFDVTLTNTAKSQNLGSADLYAPANITVTAASIASGGGSGTSTLSTYENAVTPDPNDATSTGRSLISLRNLTVPGGTSVRVQVSANVTGTGTKYWYSIVKQANQFNPGSLDLSNTFTNSDGNPSFTVSACELRFVQQPKNPWEKNTTATPPVEVAVFAGVAKVSFSGTPDLAVAAGSSGVASDFEGLGSGTYNSSTLSWSWPNAKPKPAAPSGGYNLVAALGSMTATSDSNVTMTGNQPFQVVDLACDPGQTCSDFSLPHDDQTVSGVQFKNTLSTAVIVNFVPGGGPKACDPWHRASFTDASGQTLYFPGVTLNVTRQAGDTSMLKITYLVRNSEWVLTDVSRGNQDIDFCVGAKHQNTSLNGDGSHPDPFTTKYGFDARWGCEDPSATASCAEKLFWGVIPSVSNPNKVGSDPAVCARGTVDLLTGPGGISETWRTWINCVPNDWDYGIKGG